MLAYQPHIPIGYDLSLTLMSIAAAILITGAGWLVALRGERTAMPSARARTWTGVGRSALPRPAGRGGWV